MMRELELHENPTVPPRNFSGGRRHLVVTKSGIIAEVFTTPTREGKGHHRILRRMRELIPREEREMES